MVKVKLKLCPGGRSPESNAPWSAVTVWVTLSLFFQVTFVPTFTVTLAGLKEKFATETLLPPLAAAVVGVSVGAVVGVSVGAVVGAAVGAVVGVGLAEAVPPPHAVNNTRKPAMNTQDQILVASERRFFKITIVLLEVK